MVGYYILIFDFIYRTLDLKIQPKLGFLWTENYATTLPKKHKNNFEKVKNATFYIHKIARNEHLKRVKWADFFTNIYSSKVVNQSLELNVH